MNTNTDRFRQALAHIPVPSGRDAWIVIGMAAHASGLNLDDFDRWSSAGDGYDAKAVRSTWKSFRDMDGGVGAGTLIKFARENGWRDSSSLAVLSDSTSTAGHVEQAMRAVERARCDATRHAAAAERARAMWDAASPANEHPYLKRKGVQSHGLRVGAWKYSDPTTGENFTKAGCLLIPVYDRTRAIHSLQAIDSSGRKWLLAGGAKRGHFYVVGTRPLNHEGRSVFLLAEGYATAASLHESTGHLVLCAFDAGNLIHVAQALRERQPNAEIVLAADNDTATEGNPGIAAARKAAESVLGLIAVPPIAGDFNDFAIAHGHQAVSSLLADVLAGGRNEDVPAAAKSSPGEPSVVSSLVVPELMELLPFTDARDGTADTHPLTEHGNALRLRDAFGSRLRYVVERKTWPVWGDGRWHMADPGMVRALAGGLAANIYSEGGRHLTESEHFAKWARRSQERRVIDAAVSLLSDMASVRLPAAQLDANPWVCGMDQGRKTLDLKLGIVRAATQADYITKSLAVDELGAPVKAVRWCQFINEVFQGDATLIDWMHRFLGYVLTGDVTEQLFVFLFGNGANGKSVLTEVISQLMGEYATAVQPATLCDDRRSAAGPSPDLARLDGVRFAVAPEAEEGSRFNEALLKGLVSGDTMQVRELHASPRDMHPTLKLAMTGNHKPHISGTDRGIWRRVRLVPFLTSFEGKADPKLLEKLRDEFPHILAWLVSGCLEWQRRGLQDTPAAIALATESYRTESDTLGQWLEERCKQDVKGRELFADLYADFRWWSASNGFSKIPASLSFGKRLAEYRLGGWNIGAEKYAGKRCRTGLMLKQASPFEDRS